MNKLKPFAAYKDSKLPWVGKVPLHWNLMPNRALMQRQKTLVGQKHSDYRLLSLTKNGVIVRDVESGKGKFSVDMGTCQEVREGDLVFCLFDIPETPRTVGLAHDNGMITGAYTIFRSTKPALATFLDIFYRAMDDRKLLSPLYSGLRNTIQATRFLGIKTPTPPLPEQEAIVLFLNYIDLKVRKFINAKRKLISLLNEQKQAIIHKAVTRGLDPNVKLKPSGVEWLGDVPEHWDIFPAMSRIIEKQVKNSGLTVEKVLSLSYGRIVVKPVDKLHGLVPESFETYQIVEPGNIIIRPTDLQNDQRSLRVGMVRDKGIITSAYMCLKVHDSLSPEYAYLLLHTYDLNKIFYQLGSGTRQSLKFSDIKKLPILVPPSTEQSGIIQFICNETGKLDKTIEHVRQELRLIEEFFMVICSNIATGKLDVRSAAVNLPKELDEKDQEVSDGAELLEDENQNQNEVENEEVLA